MRNAELRFIFKTKFFPGLWIEQVGNSLPSKLLGLVSTLGKNGLEVLTPAQHLQEPMHTGHLFEHRIVRWRKRIETRTKGGIAKHELQHSKLRLVERWDRTERVWQCDTDAAIHFRAGAGRGRKVLRRERNSSPKCGIRHPKDFAFSEERRTDAKKGQVAANADRKYAKFAGRAEHSKPHVVLKLRDVRAGRRPRQSCFVPIHRSVPAGHG